MVGNMNKKGKNLIKGKKYKSYVVGRPNYISILYLLLFYSIVIFLIVGSLTNTKFALPFLFLIPTIIAFIVLYFLLPIRFLMFLINHIILFFYLKNLKENKPSTTVIVLGKSEYKSPSFWFNPSYDLELILLIKYLRLKREDFSLYKNVDIKTLDKIMSNKKIKNVYLVGHGRRHGFMIDSNTIVDYCRYNNKKYKKEFVYQLHCNGGKGVSLVEYVVPKRNQKLCWPEYGYLTTLSISRMFIDNIIKLKKYKGIAEFLARLYYNSLVYIPSLIAVFLWMFIFIKLIGGL